MIRRAKSSLFPIRIKLNASTATNQGIFKFLLGILHVDVKLREKKKLGTYVGIPLCEPLWKLKYMESKKLGFLLLNSHAKATQYLIFYKQQFPHVRE